MKHPILRFQIRSYQNKLQIQRYSLVENTDKVFLADFTPSLLLFDEALLFL